MTKTDWISNWNGQFLFQIRSMDQFLSHKSIWDFILFKMEFFIRKSLTLTILVLLVGYNCVLCWRCNRNFIIILKRTVMMDNYGVSLCLMISMWCLKRNYHRHGVAQTPLRYGNEMFYKLCVKYILKRVYLNIYSKMCFMLGFWWIPCGASFYIFLTKFIGSDQICRSK